MATQIGCLGCSEIDTSPEIDKYTNTKYRITLKRYGCGNYVFHFDGRKWPLDCGNEDRKKVSKKMCYTVNEHFARKLSSFTDPLASISHWLRAVNQPISCNFMNNLCPKRNTRIRSTSKAGRRFLCQRLTVHLTHIHFIFIYY